MPTIGVEHRQKDLLIEDIELKLNIWDTTGQEKYRAVTATFFKGSSGCLVVFDLSHRGTFAGVERWLGEVQSHASQQTITILVGNKLDLAERQVTTLEAETFAKKHGMEYFETSAQTGHNVKATFERLVAKIWERNAAQYKQFKNNEQKRLVALTDPPQGRPGRKRCCSG